MPRAKKTLLGEALLAVCLVRSLLLLLPFRWLYAWSRRWERALLAGPAADVDARREQELSRVVQAVGRRIPGATCLTQAMALQMLLARQGKSSALRIGVAKNAEGKFHAHAWLQTPHGVAIGGGRHLDSFTPLRGPADER